MEKKKNGVGSVLTDDWESDLAAIIEKTNQNLNLLRKIGEKREEPKLTSGLLSRTRSSPLMMNSNANDYRATAESSSSISKWKKVLDESTTMKRHIATKILDSTKTKSDAARGAWDATTLTNHDGQRETTKPTSFQPLVPMDDVRKSLEVDIAARAKTIENMVNDQRLDFKRLASECAASRTKTDEIVQMIDTKMQRLEAFEMDATKALESLPRVETQTIALLKWKGMVEYDMQSATLKLDSVVSAQDKWTRLERQVSDIELKLQRLPTMDDLVETLTKRVQELERQVSKTNADGHGIAHAVKVAVNKAMQTMDDRVTKRIDDATTMHDTKTASFVKTLNSQREHAEKSMQFALDASISDIHVEIDQVTKRMETRVHDLHVSNDTRVTALTKRIAAVEVAIADVDSNPTSDITDEQHRKLQTRLDSCVTKQQVGAVVAEHIESSVGLRRMETSLAKTQQDHDRKWTEVRQELSTTQDDLARVHGTIASIQSAIHKTSSVENQVLRAKLLQSVTELDELHQVKHDMTAHFDRRSKEHDAAVAALTAQVAAADKKREDDVATLTKALTEKSVQVASTQGKLTGLQECWNRDVEQMQSTRASMLKAQRESADMRTALQKCQGDVARQNVEKQHLVDAIRRLTSQWTTARDEAVQAKGTLHQATQQHTGRVRLLESTIAKLQVVHASTMLRDATVSSSASREVARLTSDLASTQVELQSVQEELQEVSASKLKVEAQLNTCLLQMQSGNRQDEIGRAAQAARQVALDNAQKKMKELMTREHDVATAVEALLTTLNMTRTPAVEPSTMVDTLQLIQNTVREWHTQKLVGADNAAMDKLQRLVDANQVELTAQQVAWEGKLQAYAGQLQAVLDQKADVEADLAQLKKQLELELARQQQVEVDAAAAIEAHIATERQLQDKVFELEAMVAAITSQKTSMESNLTALQATHMNATRDARGTSDSVIASLKQKLKDAQAKHDDATQQAAALEAKLKGLQDSNKTLTDEYNSVCHVLDQCNVALNATEEDVKTLQLQLTQAQYQVQEREAKLQTALAKIDCVTEDKDRAESTLLQLQTELATVQHAQVDAAKTDQSQLDQVRAKVDVLVQEKQAVEAKLLLVAAREEALHEERAQLKLQSDARELEVQSQVKTLTDALKAEQDATATREVELNALIEHITITTPSSNHTVKSNGDGNSVATLKAAIDNVLEATVVKTQTLDAVVQLLHKCVAHDDNDGPTTVTSFVLANLPELQPVLCQIKSLHVEKTQTTARVRELVGELQTRDQEQEQLQLEVDAQRATIAALQHAKDMMETNSAVSIQDLEATKAQWKESDILHQATIKTLTADYDKVVCREKLVREQLESLVQKCQSELDAMQANTIDDLEEKVACLEADIQRYATDLVQHEAAQAKTMADIDKEQEGMQRLQRDLAMLRNQLSMAPSVLYHINHMHGAITAPGNSAVGRDRARIATMQSQLAAEVEVTALQLTLKGLDISYVVNSIQRLPQLAERLAQLSVTINNTTVVRRCEWRGNNIQTGADLSAPSRGNDSLLGRIEASHANETTKSEATALASNINSESANQLASHALHGLYGRTAVVNEVVTSALRQYDGDEEVPSNPDNFDDDYDESVSSMEASVDNDRLGIQSSGDGRRSPRTSSKDGHESVDIRSDLAPMTLMDTSAYLQLDQRVLAQHHEDDSHAKVPNAGNLQTESIAVKQAISESQPNAEDVATSKQHDNGDDDGNEDEVGSSAHDDGDEGQQSRASMDVSMDDMIASSTILESSNERRAERVEDEGAHVLGSYEGNMGNSVEALQVKGGQNRPPTGVEKELQAIHGATTLHATEETAPGDSPMSARAASPHNSGGDIESNPDDDQVGDDSVAGWVESERPSSHRMDTSWPASSTPPSIHGVDQVEDDFESTNRKVDTVPVLNQSASSSLFENDATSSSLSSASSAPAPALSPLALRHNFDDDVDLDIVQGLMLEKMQQHSADQHFGHDDSFDDSFDAPASPVHGSSSRHDDSSVEQNSDGEEALSEAFGRDKVAVPPEPFHGRGAPDDTTESVEMSRLPRENIIVSHYEVVDQVQLSADEQDDGSYVDEMDESLNESSLDQSTETLKPRLGHEVSPQHPPHLGRHDSQERTESNDQAIHKLHPSTGSKDGSVDQLVQDKPRAANDTDAMRGQNDSEDNSGEVLLSDGESEASMDASIDEVSPRRVGAMTKVHNDTPGAAITFQVSPIESSDNNIGTPLATTSQLLPISGTATAPTSSAQERPALPSQTNDTDVAGVDVKVQSRYPSDAKEFLDSHEVSFDDSKDDRAIVSKVQTVHGDEGDYLTSDDKDISGDVNQDLDVSQSMSIQPIVPPIHAVEGTGPELGHGEFFTGTDEAKAKAAVVSKLKADATDLEDVERLLTEQSQTATATSKDDTGFDNSFDASFDDDAGHDDETHQSEDEDLSDFEDGDHVGGEVYEIDTKATHVGGQGGPLKSLLGDSGHVAVELQIAATTLLEPNAPLGGSVHHHDSGEEVDSDVGECDEDMEQSGEESRSRDLESPPRLTSSSDSHHVALHEAGRFVQGSVELHSTTAINGKPSRLHADDVDLDDVARLMVEQGQLGTARQSKTRGASLGPLDDGELSGPDEDDGSVTTDASERGEEFASHPVDPSAVGRADSAAIATRNDHSIHSLSSAVVDTFHSNHVTTSDHSPLSGDSDELGSSTQSILSCREVRLSAQSIPSFGFNQPGQHTKPNITLSGDALSIHVPSPVDDKDGDILQDSFSDQDESVDLSRGEDGILSGKNDSSLHTSSPLAAADLNQGGKTPTSLHGEAPLDSLRSQTFSFQTGLSSRDVDTDEVERRMMDKTQYSARAFGDASELKGSAPDDDVASADEELSDPDDDGESPDTVGTYDVHGGKALVTQKAGDHARVLSHNSTQSGPVDPRSSANAMESLGLDDHSDDDDNDDEDEHHVMLDNTSDNTGHGVTASRAHQFGLSLNDQDDLDALSDDDDIVDSSPDGRDPTQAGVGERVEDRAITASDVRRPETDEIQRDNLPSVTVEPSKELSPGKSPPRLSPKLAPLDKMSWRGLPRIASDLAHLEHLTLNGSPPLASVPGRDDDDFDEVSGQDDSVEGSVDDNSHENDHEERNQNDVNEDGNDDDALPSFGDAVPPHPSVVTLSTAGLQYVATSDMLLPHDNDGLENSLDLEHSFDASDDDMDDVTQHSMDNVSDGDEIHHGAAQVDLPSRRYDAALDVSSDGDAMERSRDDSSADDTSPSKPMSISLSQRLIQAKLRTLEPKPDLTQRIEYTEHDSPSCSVEGSMELSHELEPVDATSDDENEDRDDESENDVVTQTPRTSVDSNLRDQTLVPTDIPSTIPTRHAHDDDDAEVEELMRGHISGSTVKQAYGVTGMTPVVSSGMTSSPWMQNASTLSTQSQRDPYSAVNGRDDLEDSNDDYESYVTQATSGNKIVSSDLATSHVNNESDDMEALMHENLSTIAFKAHGTQGAASPSISLGPASSISQDGVKNNDKTLSHDLSHDGNVPTGHVRTTTPSTTSHTSDDEDEVEALMRGHIPTPAAKAQRTMGRLEAAQSLTRDALTLPASRQNTPYRNADEGVDLDESQDDVASDHASDDSGPSPLKKLPNGNVAMPTGKRPLSALRSLPQSKLSPLQPLSKLPLPSVVSSLGRRNFADDESLDNDEQPLGPKVIIHSNFDDDEDEFGASASDHSIVVANQSMEAADNLSPPLSPHAITTTPSGHDVQILEGTVSPQLELHRTTPSSPPTSPIPQTNAYVTSDRISTATTAAPSSPPRSPSRRHGTTDDDDDGAYSDSFEFEESVASDEETS